MNELIFASAIHLGDAIAKMKISSLEGTEAHLKRICEVNPKLNAVFHLAAEAAIKVAKAADEELARGVLAKSAAR